MHYALDLARKAYDQGEVPVGAVIVRDGRIIGEGWNRPIGANDPSAHAEIVALRDAGAKESNYRLPDSVMYVTIEPCTMCVGALIHARVSKVVYGAVEPKAGAVVSRNKLFEHDSVNTVVEHAGGVCEDECSAIISAFFAERRAHKKRAKYAKSAADKHG
ncbi:tRNA adenosine(34) deaminase TadA [Alkalimarinus coralli]|nr:tRNA adenosine(34) deaminase TadA [Alkalimarinus coralli]